MGPAHPLTVVFSSTGNSFSQTEDSIAPVAADAGWLWIMEITDRAAWVCAFRSVAGVLPFSVAWKEGNVPSSFRGEQVQKGIPQYDRVEAAVVGAELITSVGVGLPLR